MMVVVFMSLWGVLSMQLVKSEPGKGGAEVCGDGPAWEGVSDVEPPGKEAPSKA